MTTCAGAAIICTGGGPPPPGPGCPPLSNVFYVDGGTSTPAVDQDGAICTPFDTITKALLAVGALSQATIFVTPGTYDEDLSIPADRQIAIEGLGQVDLGTGAPARNITWATDTGFLGLENIHVTGKITISDNAAPAGALFLYQGPTDIDGDLDATTYTGDLEIAFVNTRLPGAGNVEKVDAPTASLAGYERKFNDEVIVDRYERIVGCNFGGPMTVGSGPSLSGDAAGFYRCTFTDAGGGPHTFTFPAARTFRLDGVTEFHFEQTGSLLAGPGGDDTYDRIDDPMQRREPTTVVLPFTADAPNRIYYVTGGFPASVFTLPASPRVDDEFVVVDDTGTASGGSPITIDSGVGNLINGVQTYSLALAYGSVRLKCRSVSPNVWRLV
jgi:hypothetical protein